MPPGKSWEAEIKNRKLGGDFSVANCLETHGTECDNSAYDSSNFFLLASLTDFQGCI